VNATPAQRSGNVGLAGPGTTSLPWQILLDRAGGGCWQWDAASGSIGGDDRVETLLSLGPSGRIPAVTFLSFVHPDDAAAVWKLVADVSCGGADNFGHDCRLRTGQDQYHLVRISGAVTSRLADGHVSEVVGLVFDCRNDALTESQRRRSMALESVGQLAAGVAHEINTPLQFVGDNLAYLESECQRGVAAIEFIERLREELSGTPLWRALGAEMLDEIDHEDFEYFRQEYPRAIRESVAGIEHVSEIVRAMKAFAYTGQAARLPVDLNGLIANSITLTRTEWKHVAEVVRDFDGELPLIHCAPQELGQLLVNLIVNAADAIAEAGRGMGTITLRTRRFSTSAVVEVIDTGAGIPEDIRTRLYESFFTTKKMGKGTGQGLALAREIVTRHSGLLSFQSEVGRGTSFRIELPLPQEGNRDETHPFR
jgi:signal transduction histidine kinase